MEPKNVSSSAVASTTSPPDVGGDVEGAAAVARMPYEKPQILKKRSVSRVTLTSGGGTGGAAGGLIGMM